MAMIAKARKLGDSNRLKPTKKNVSEQRSQLLKAHLLQLATQQGTTLQVAGSSVIEEEISTHDTQTSPSVETEFIDPLVQSSGPTALHNGIAAVASQLDLETASDIDGLLDTGRVAGLSRGYSQSAEADLEFGKEVVSKECFFAIVRISARRMAEQRKAKGLTLVGSEASMLELQYMSLAT